MLSFLPAFLAITLAICERYVVDDLPYLADEDCGSCERVYVPICATDNTTYTNECRFYCLNQNGTESIVMYGPCVAFTAIVNRRTEISKLIANVSETDIIKIQYTSNYVSP